MKHQQNNTHLRHNIKVHHRITSFSTNENTSKRALFHPPQAMKRPNLGIYIRERSSQLSMSRQASSNNDYDRQAKNLHKQLLPCNVHHAIRTL
jgi:hypothetical protein